ncbi:hypothetical protein [Xanthomonas sp. NCPPB 2632]|uniref:hypothetical protein n=1 Tax=Xanthomonas sp. NCPPB 2632 TaxID=3240912 RepID=UPI003519C41C
MATDVVERVQNGTFPTIDHGGLGTLAEAGAIEGARAIGLAGSWALIVLSKGREWVLTATTSKAPRGFAKVETLVNYVAQFQVRNVELDVESAANVAVKTRRRLDRSEALRALWEADLREVRDDPRPKRAHEDVLARSQARWAADLAEEAHITAASQLRAKVG